MFLVTFYPTNAKKKDLQIYFSRFNQAISVKLNHMKVELFYHQTDNQAKIFYVLEYKKLTWNAHSEIKTHQLYFWELTVPFSCHIMHGYPRSSSFRVQHISANHVQIAVKDTANISHFHKLLSFSPFNTRQNNKLRNKN